MRRSQVELVEDVVVVAALGIPDFPTVLDQGGDRRDNESVRAEESREPDGGALVGKHSFRHGFHRVASALVRAGLRESTDRVEHFRPIDDLDLAIRQPGRDVGFQNRDLGIRNFR